MNIRLDSPSGTPGGAILAGLLLAMLASAAAAQVTWSTPRSMSNRSDHAMAYDAARGRVVLFGGSKTKYALSGLADTWEWDGLNWTQRSPATSPRGRMWHAMAYDAARGRTVLFGGAGGKVLAFSDT